MLSQIVTAARGLFKRSNSTEDTASEQEQSSDMVTSTRQSAFSQDTPVSQDSPVSSGKRKETPSSAADNTDNRPQKRRRGRANLGSSRSGTSTPVPTLEESAKPKRYQVLESVTIVSQPNTDSTLTTPVDAPSSTQISVPMPKASYIRFGSEEPTATNGTQQEADDIIEDAELKNGPQLQTNGEADEDDDSSDDEAPEAFSNAAQLSQIRDEERKKEETKHMHEQSRREKRREHEKRLQLQAASKAANQKAADIRQEAKARKAKAKASKHDEQRSESSMTLSAGTRDSKLSLSAPLPALLPDEILNAEPSTRPLITAFEVERLKKTGNPRHIRLTDANDKPPRELKVGSTAIRVLGDSGSGFNAALPPKSSNVSKRVRENWVGGKRKRGATGALRHTTGGPSSFVRK
ncbi:hypothetical protein FQN49_007842 [Arthroderma sp. PD_2]|nr:hypothetical protein FQN49_007842 [Arthroderma sp. PD_2]